MTKVEAIKLQKKVCLAAWKYKTNVHFKQKLKINYNMFFSCWFRFGGNLNVDNIEQKG